MIDPIYKVSEKLLELARYRGERRERQFEKVIQPTYLAVQELHEDYVSMLSSAIFGLQSGRPLAKVQSTLALARLRRHGKRLAVLNQAAALADMGSLSFAKTFFTLVADYFDERWGFLFPRSPMATRRSSSWQQEIARYIRSAVAPLKAQPTQLIVHLQSELERLNRLWSLVSAEYARQQAQAVR